MIKASKKDAVGRWDKRTDLMTALASYLHDPVSVPADINLISVEKVAKCKDAGKGCVTIDSGAGDSVGLVSIIPEEELVHTSKVGMRCRSAGGQPPENKGEKRVKFKAGGTIGAMGFQGISELSKPLASATRIVPKGNRIVMGDGDSNIQSKKSGVRIPIYAKNGVRFMTVEFLVEDTESAAEPLFRRQV